MWKWYDRKKTYIGRERSNGTTTSHPQGTNWSCEGTKCLRQTTLCARAPTDRASAPNGSGPIVTLAGEQTGNRRGTAGHRAGAALAKAKPGNSAHETSVPKEARQNENPRTLVAVAAGSGRATGGQFPTKTPVKVGSTGFEPVTSTV